MGIDQGMMDDALLYFIMFFDTIGYKMCTISLHFTVIYSYFNN